MTGSARRLRVLQVGKYYYPYRGGMETHLRALCTALRDEVDLDVVVANTSSERRDDIVDGVRIRRLATPMHLRAAPLSIGLRAAMRQSTADIVHIHVPHPGAILAHLAARPRARLIVTYHSDIVRQRVLGTAFAPFMNAALRQAAAIICTSPNYIETSPVLRRHRSRCHVLPFGVDLRPFESAPPAEVARYRALYGPRIVLGVGRLVDYKGFEFAIRAIADVRATLLLVGTGPLREHLGRLSVECGVADRVVFLDEVEHLAPLVHAADVFVLPSVARSEAFGLVQLEAMAAGKPVVNTDLPSGVGYVSPDGVSGLTVPPRDPPALARALERLLDDPMLRKRYGDAGRERARTVFNVDAMADATLALYHDVVGGAGGRRTVSSGVGEPETQTQDSPLTRVSSV